MYNRCAHVHCIKFMEDFQHILKNFIFFCSYGVSICIFLNRNVVKQERTCILLPCIYACILLPCCLFFIAKLLLDACFIPFV